MEFSISLSAVLLRQFADPRQRIPPLGEAGREKLRNLARNVVKRILTIHQVENEAVYLSVLIKSRHMAGG